MLFGLLRGGGDFQFPWRQLRKQTTARNLIQSYIKKSSTKYIKKVLSYIKY